MQISKLKKINFTTIKKKNIEKVLVYNKIYSGKKTINTLSVTCIIINLRHYIQWFLKKGHNVKRYDGQTKWMYLLIEDDDLLEKGYSLKWSQCWYNKRF